MNAETKACIEAYVQACREEQKELLCTLGQIPSPTGEEDRRAVFCRDWLLAQGARQVTIDEAENVICPIGDDGTRDLVVFAAHTDVVFPDKDPLPMEEREGRLYAPGIGDDTANLVNLLLAARYLIQHHIPLTCGLLIVANSCEEGLGNLRGTKAIFERYGTRIRAFYSFDLYLPLCCHTAVGSYRYRVTCKTRGGHSYGDFGRPSAVRILCGLVDELYRIDPPTRARTTYNVGRMEGGTTVNSIPQEASILYEFRSTAQDCLEEMEQKFRTALSHWQDRGGTLEVELLGIRPGNGPVDPAALEALTARSTEVIRTFTGREPEYTPTSTDGNIPLSLGIPANTVGTVTGGLEHTRQEWIDLACLPTGLKVALGLMLGYAAPNAPDALETI